MGFKPPFEEIRFGPFTGNKQIQTWFKQLCSVSGLNGKAKIFYKIKGNKHTTPDITPDEALNQMKAGLVSGKKAYIYHCYNHYMVPIGFEDMPTAPENVFKKNLEEHETQIIVAENSRKHPTFHCLAWESII